MRRVTVRQAAALTKARAYLDATEHLPGNASALWHQASGAAMTQAQFRHLVALAERKTTPTPAPRLRGPEAETEEADRG